MKSSTRKNSTTSNRIESRFNQRALRYLIAPLVSVLGLALLAPGEAWSAAPESPREWVDAETGLSFVWIAAGCFDMGTNEAKGSDLNGTPRSPRDDESPRHRVCVDGYWMGRYEITRAQWQHVLGAEASPSREEAQRPVVNITWQQAQLFLQRLNRRADLGRRFRLPTEAEWEYACLPGEPKSDIEENRWEREDELKASAWFRGNKRGATDASEVGTLAANPRGLHDMLGNVWEWIDDSYQPDAYQGHRRNNPRASDQEGRKVLRGGGFRSDLQQTRCGARSFGLIDDALPTVGLRLVGEKTRPK